MEPLLNKINSTINGIIYNPLTTFTPSTTLSNFTKKVKSQAFADDIITFNQDSIDINKTIQIFSEFENISGLKLNHQKTKLYCNPSSIQHIKSAITDDIEVTSITENPTYLGVPLMKTNWYKKLDLLTSRLRRICFMDLPLHLIILGINTYIFSTIYFLDQHDPIPTPILQSFINNVKSIVRNQIWPKIPTNKDYWYIPRKQGGFGMMDLETQLQGRRAFFILYMLDPSQSGAKHPYLPQLLRINLQSNLLYSQYINNTINTIQTQVNEAIQLNKQHPTTIQTSHHFTQYLQHLQHFTPWYLLTTNYNNQLKHPSTSHISIHPSKITVRYSEMFREQHRQQHFDERNQQEAWYLDHNIIPPSLGPYPPPSHTSLSSDIILQVNISPETPIYHPLQTYLTAWRNTVTLPNLPVEDSEMTDHITGNTINQPQTITSYNNTLQTKLQNRFLNKNKSQQPSNILYQDLNHLSSKLHQNINYISTNTKTWANNAQLGDQEWKNFFNNINQHIFTKPQDYYYLYALNTGLLNNTFYSSCLCGLPFNGTPIRHVINECNITIHIFKFIKNQSNQQNTPQYSTNILICPQKPQTSSFTFINNFTKFLVYCHRVAYAKRPEILQWENENIIEDTYWDFKYR